MYSISRVQYIISVESSKATHVSADRVLKGFFATDLCIGREIQTDRG